MEEGKEGVKEGRRKGKEGKRRKGNEWEWKGKGGRAETRIEKESKTEKRREERRSEVKGKKEGNHEYLSGVSCWRHVSRAPHWWTLLSPLKLIIITFLLLCKKNVRMINFSNQYYVSSSSSSLYHYTTHSHNTYPQTKTIIYLIILVGRWALGGHRRGWKEEANTYTH